MERVVPRLSHIRAMKDEKRKKASFRRFCTQIRDLNLDHLLIRAARYCLRAGEREDVTESVKNSNQALGAQPQRAHSEFSRITPVYATLTPGSNGGEARVDFYHLGHSIYIFFMVII